jgi:hypothetical protein
VFDMEILADGRQVKGAISELYVFDMEILADGRQVKGAISEFVCV